MFPSSQVVARAGFIKRVTVDSYRETCLERPHACFNAPLSHLKILNNFLIRCPVFSFYTEPYKVYSQSWL